MTLERPDILLLSAAWPERSLLRAQLIEEGHDVVAIDEWPMPKLYLTPGMTPRAAIVDLQQLPDPARTLEALRQVVPPNRILVLTALGTLNEDDLRRMGFRVLARPMRVSQVVAAAAPLIRND